MKHWNLKIREQGLKVIACNKCGKTLQQTSPRQKYCGNRRQLGSCSAKAEYEATLRWRKKTGFKPVYYPRQRVEIDCLKCGSKFTPWANGKQKYCGSKTKKIGCSWKVHIFERGEQRRQRQHVRRLELRFEVFKRDGFTCQYCGRKAPDVSLHVDHIHPQSKQGLNDSKNLRTACSDCNLGKSDVLLTEFLI